MQSNKYTQGKTDAPVDSFLKSKSIEKHTNSSC